jgi:flavin-dependent dehydrogenase
MLDGVLIAKALKRYPNNLLKAISTYEKSMRTKSREEAGETYKNLKLMFHEKDSPQTFVADMDRMMKQMITQAALYGVFSISTLAAVGAGGLYLYRHLKRN